MTVGASCAGGVDPARFAQMRQKLFKKIDANGDGKIDRAEMSAFGEKRGLSADKIDKIFSKLDTNGDGVIDQTENDAASAKIEQRLKKFLEKKKAGGKIGSEEDSKLLMDLLQQPDATGSNPSQASTSLLDEFLAHLKEHQPRGSYDQAGNNTTQSTDSLFNKLV